MTKTSLFKKILIFCCLVILLLGICFYMLFNDIKTKNVNISTLEQELSAQSQTQQYMSTMQHTVQDSSDDIKKINGAIIEKDGDIAFIENLETLARANGLDINIESLTFQEDPMFQGTDIVSFKLGAKARGPWSGSYAFLSKLETLKYKVRIDNFALLNGSDGGAPADPKKKVEREWNTEFEIHALKYK